MFQESETRRVKDKWTKKIALKPEPLLGYAFNKTN